MAFLIKSLNKILCRKNDFCCLCFYDVMLEEAYNIEDEVIMDDEHIIMSDIIRIFLPIEATQLNISKRMCSNCVKLTMNTYKFMKMVKKNWKTLNILMEVMNASLDYNLEKLHLHKSLFLTVDTSDFSTDLYYDTNSPTCNNSSKIVKNDTCPKIDDIVTNKSQYIQSDDNLKICDKVKVKKKINRKQSSIPISEMLCDGDNAENYTCKLCFHVYPTQYNLKQHFIRVHAPKTFKCPDCPRQYGSAWILEQHRYESHNNTVCSQCGKTYNNRHSLKKHEMGHTLNFICETCGRSFKRKSTYNKHITLNECNRRRMSPSQAQFTCDACGKRFCQKATLRVHITFEHGNRKAYECMWCNKRFYAQSKLNAHTVRHTKEKNFSCLQCGGKFVTKESLLYHTRIHTGDKPYKCDLCDDRFLSASRRMAHFRRHHVGEIYECDICQSKFKSKSLLEKHKKKHIDFIV